MPAWLKPLGKVLNRSIALDRKEMTGSKRKATEENDTDKVLKNNLTTYFRRQASGFYKNTSEEDVAIAKNSQTQYKGMSKTEQLAFAKAFQANKHSKSFQWMKDFTDSLSVKTQTSDKALEKYMTRSFAIKGYMRDA